MPKKKILFFLFVSISYLSYSISTFEKTECSSSYNWSFGGTGVLNSRVVGDHSHCLCVYQSQSPLQLNFKCCFCEYFGTKLAQCREIIKCITVHEAAHWNGLKSVRIALWQALHEAHDVVLLCLLLLSQYVSDYKTILVGNGTNGTLDYQKVFNLFIF